MPFSFRLYRWLTRLYPPRFREEYGSALEAGFRDEYREAADGAARLRLWAATLRDLLLSAPGLFAREIGSDARQTFRLWARRPFHTGLAVLALAIGIGANTGVFSVLNALLLRSLPFRQPERLASMWMFNPAGLTNNPDHLHNWRKQSTYMEDAAEFGSVEVNLDGARESARIRLTESSWNFFTLLGAQPALGRNFADGEDQPGRNAVAVIGYGLWQQMFGGDPRVLGTVVRLNGAPLVIVGVAPPNFDYPAKTVIWSPTAFELQRIPITGVYAVETVGRLKNGISWSAAQAAFEAEALGAYPAARGAKNASRPALRPLEEQLAGPVKQATFVLMGGVALILLIACGNVAHFLLARTVDRSSELLIRAALGAGPTRLAQQLLTESLLLSGAAATVGMAVAWWTTAVASAVQPAPLATQTYSLLDWRVLGFAILLSFATGLIFGVLPAIHVSRLRVSPAVLRGAPTTPGAGLWRRGLIATQVALAIVLLAGSVVVGRAFLALLQTDTGYRTRQIVTASVSLAGTGYRESRADAYQQEALRRVREIPGVESASTAEFLPLATSMFMGANFRIDAAGAPALAVTVPIAPGFFHAMGGRVLYGREFQEGDDKSPDPLLLVNEQFARRFSDPATITGRSLTTGIASRKIRYRVIGVVQGMRYSGPYVDPGDQAFTLSGSSSFFTLVAQVSGSTQNHLSRVRAAMQSVDPKIPVFDVKSMEDRLAESLARPRFYTTAVLFFAVFALLLAATGIYGAASYAVVQRTREIGIRLALGATPPRVRGSLMKQGLFTVALGALPAVPAAFAASRYLASLLPGAEPVSASVFGVAIAPVCLVAAAGIWSATRRIARLDLTDTLRAE